MMSPALILAAVSLFPPDSLPGDWRVGFRPLLAAGATVSWDSKEPVLETWEMDFSTEFTLATDEFDLLATGALRRDSLLEVSLRRVRAEARWPGSPWVGAGVFFADRQPFAAGLRDPVIEWGWMDIDSTLGFTASAGGILGFSGNVALLAAGSGDTLIWTGVDAPWLGFGTARWSRFRRNTMGEIDEIHVVTAMADFRYMEPWVVVIGGDGKSTWGVLGEIRGVKPFETGSGLIEIVPGLSFAGDSLSLPDSSLVPGQQVLSLNLLHIARNHFISMNIEGYVDLNSRTADGILAKFDMVSCAGIEYGIQGEWNETDHLSMLFDCDYRRSEAGGGISIATDSDSVRLSGRASYSPLRSVSTFMEVSADLFDETMDPAGTLRIFTCSGPISASIALQWKNDLLFYIDLRGCLW